MTTRPGNEGGRCAIRRKTDSVCALHERHGALIPDGWTPSGLPIFHRSRAT